MNQKMTKISALRQDYNLNELLEENVFADPIKQFAKWFEDAAQGDIYEPNAMILSTVKDNQPRSRTVLLKGFSETGFEFYTNYASDKGKEMANQPNVSLLFHWDKLQRQVRIEGKVERLPSVVSDAYYQTRPRGSQVGAWVSEQSEVIESREFLENKLAYFTEKFGEENPIPRPDHWGGYIVKPAKIEFWQGRPSRLHDRLLYTFTGENWKISRLSP